MRIIGQYAEMANLQKSARKDENQLRKDEVANNSTRTHSSSSDVAELSDGARKMADVYQMKSKLKDIPDPREEKVNDVIERLRSGALLNQASVRSSIARMIEQGVFV